MKHFHRSSREPNKSVNGDERAKRAPRCAAYSIMRRLREISGRTQVRRARFAGAFPEPSLPKTIQALRDFRRGKKNHQSNAQDASADEILNEGIAHQA